MLAPIDVADNPLSTPLTPPIAAPAFLAMACFVTADEPQLGHLIIFCSFLIIGYVKVIVVARVSCMTKIVSN
jgi:hypothetical protein